MIIHRLSPGIYDVTVGTTNYEVEQYPDGNWLVFLTLEHGRDFINDFATKRAAVAAIRSWSTQP